MFSRPCHSLHYLLEFILSTPFTTLNPSLHLIWLKIMPFPSPMAGCYVSTIRYESGGMYSNKNLMAMVVVPTSNPSDLKAETTGV